MGQNGQGMAQAGPLASPRLALLPAEQQLGTLASLATLATRALLLLQAGTFSRHVQPHPLLCRTGWWWLASVLCLC